MPASGQAPHEEWRTLGTKHFRFHYPREYEAWTLRAASRVESIREAVTREAGFAPEAVTDVLVMNPSAAANGATLPLLDTPRIVLLTEPPGPDEQIGEYGEWIDLLLVHEITHLVHLLRPSRNPMERAAERLFLPLGPIVLRAPRWVTEGYATLVEGRLTGSGRPPGSIRAAILRKWAQQGRLPGYAQLNSDKRFAGMSMAYLAGSAFLQWLEERAGEGALRKLWARMSARERRSFDDAFTGVFGAPPERLYGEFTAELTERAVSVDRESRAALREGTLWQETSHESGDPAVSPDGRQIAVVLRARNQPPRLVIWPTGAPLEDEGKLEKRLTSILRRDPEDVAPVRTRPLPRKPLHTLSLPDGGDLSSPRWMPDGASLLVSHRVPDRDGFLHRDLFRWTPQTGSVERITHLADLGGADPLPDGKRAVAVRSRSGFTQLVLVDLGSGAVTAMTEPSIERVVAHPRVNAAGSRLAYVAHIDGVWRLVVRDLDNGGERLLDAGERANVTSAEWMGNDLVATVSQGGFIELHRFRGETHDAITRISGAATQPAPSPDGRIFFMALEPDGFTLRVLESPEAAPPREVASRSLVPALAPSAPKPTAFATEVPAPSRPYGAGRQEIDWIAAGNFSPSIDNDEIGLRAGDVLGRLDTLLLASFGDVRGGAIAAAWHGWPVTPAVHLFHEERDRGGELRASWTGQTPLVRFSASGGAVAARSHDFAFADLGARAGVVRGSVRMSDQLRFFATSGGVRSAGVFNRLAIAPFGVQVEFRRSGGEPIPVGGIVPSIEPRGFALVRVTDPALPATLLAGRSYRGTQVDATFGGVTLFAREHRAGTRLRLAGAEIVQAIDPQPLVRLPALRFSIGAARIFDAPLRNRTKWWINITVRP